MFSSKVCQQVWFSISVKPFPNGSSAVPSPEDNDGAITFTAKPSDEPPQDTQSLESSSITYESTWPWSNSESGKPSQQEEEFPSSNDNQGYVPSYTLPTNSSLGQLSKSQNEAGSSRMPAVFEIFTIAENPEKAASSRSGSNASAETMKAEGSKEQTAEIGRFQCTATPLEAKTEDKPNVVESDTLESPTVAINMAFEGDEEKSTIYRLWQFLVLFNYFIPL